MAKSVTITAAGDLLKDGRYHIRFGKRELEFADIEAARDWVRSLLGGPEPSEDLLAAMEMSKHLMTSKPEVTNKTFTLDLAKTAVAEVKIG